MSGRKETVLDLAKFVDKGVQVKLTGGRQVTGTLKGYDQLLNLVLDEALEFLRGSWGLGIGLGNFDGWDGDYTIHMLPAGWKSSIAAHFCGSYLWP